MRLGLKNIITGATTGYVYIHDSGNDFDGTAYLARYATPDYDYGDLGTLKTLHYVKVSIKCRRYCRTRRSS